MKLRHVGITVNNIDESLIFYCDYLGLTVVSDCIEDREFTREISGIKFGLRTIKLIGDGGSILELLYYAYNDSGESFLQRGRAITDIGCSHIAFTVYNLCNLYDDLTSCGIRFVNEPKESPDGKTLVAFCYDPDDVCVELVEVLDG